MILDPARLSLLSPLSLASLSQPANFSFFAGSRCASLPSTILPRRTLPRCCSPLSRCPATVLPLSRLISPPSRPTAAALISLSSPDLSPSPNCCAALLSPRRTARISLSPRLISLLLRASPSPQTLPCCYCAHLSPQTPDLAAAAHISLSSPDLAAVARISLPKRCTAAAALA